MFSDRSASLAPSGGDIVFFSFLPAFSFRNDLRWPYLSLREERYGRKTRLVVASSTSFVLPLGAKAQSLRCSSSPHRTHFVGLRRGPCPKAALWNLAFYTGVRRGDVRRPYEFARVQLTRFRPVRGVWQAHCFHGLDCTAPTAAKTLALKE